MSFYEVPQKLQKILAYAGLGSRREIEKWIQAGRLTINGQLAQLGKRAMLTDNITLDNQLLKLASIPQQSTSVLMYYKPEYEICSAYDPEGRRTVFSHLPSINSGRWIMVGRLDYNTLGLLLFTTDGLLSHRLLHPRYSIEREYAVRVHGQVTPQILKNLQTGVLLDKKYRKFQQILPHPKRKGSNQWFHVILTEGRQREVRRLWATQGLIVSRLIRVRFGPVSLPHSMKAGEYIYLPNYIVDQLKQAVGL